MSWYNKVVWSEGLFLRPQLFQQQERYFEHFSHKRTASLSPFFWGFNQYEIDRETLLFGKLVFKSGSGIFSDGTPFDVPIHTPPPPPLTIVPEHQNQTIYLAVPLRLPNAEETTFDDRGGSLARYLAFDDELRDSNAIGQGPKPVQLCHLRLRLLPESELTESWIGIALTRIKSLKSDGAVTLHDNDHIPPVTGCSANSLLREWILQLHGLSKLRADALSARLSGSDGKAGAGAEVSDYLLLQILNRYEPLLEHMCQIGEIAPVELYRQLIMLSGELSTFVRPQTRRPVVAPGYNHMSIYGSIKPLVDNIYDLLSQVLIRSAQPIPLTDQAHGIRNAAMLPTELAGFTSLVLAVSAQMPADTLKMHFAAQTKIGPPQRLPELVRSHLPGLSLIPLPVPPRQIPFNAGYVYFELARSGPLWEQIAKHGGLAMHVAGVFPELQIELWGVRNK
ncbi:type VI secretion system baseplate subunit TssK [Glaciimonas sp. GNP009]|uniref:type VI secretion system baseplate subunit TssK n=2 Tax=Glaciimonas sp. CA11.2 TaxID=3048601 RepID=UPI002AB40892|nr:type VI secretion system baseplate subunit TssK [Glaciimonas sp. CA11.2]MDY7544834.1 type VI secretion system baseplate subunit TssK [Glaciimonas sp. CA11.2]